MDIGGDMDVNEVLDILDVFVDKSTVLDHKTQLKVPISANFNLFF